MSKISAGTGYDSQLWLDYEIKRESYSFQWGRHSVDIGVYGFNISTDVELSEDEQTSLVESLTGGNPSHPPHWQALPPNLHRTVERMTDQILEAATTADACLRQLPKGLRLRPLSFRMRATNGGQEFPVIHWRFSEEERVRLRRIYAAHGEEAARLYVNGISIPMPVHFERRQVFLTEQEVDRVGELLNAPIETTAFRKLYAIALENFTVRSYDSAVIILSTAVETALKWWLIKNGDPISEYLIANIQSPPIDRLYACARKHTTIALPKHFASWIVNLRDARNGVAHKPKAQDLNPLEVARWFAVGEAILTAVSGSPIDQMTGYIVEPVGDLSTKNFPQDSKGVVLRRELLYGEDSYHIALDTGETWRFSAQAFRKRDEQKL